MKAMKKVLAMVMAIGVVMGMSSAAMAADNNTLTNGTSGKLYTSEDEGLAQNNTLVFNKEIIIYNTNESTVHNPNVIYSYSIAPAGVTDKAQTVTDGDSDKGYVYNGVPNAVSITQNVTFTSSETTNAKSTGTIASKPITVTVIPDSFSHAGIYRYLITETDNSTARTAAGVSRPDDYKNTRYLDIYVRKDVGNANGGYVVYGYVLFTSDSPNVNITDDTSVSKNNGYVAPSPDNTTTASNVDYYNTYNLTVTKKVKGALADKNEDFPFEIAFSNLTITSQPVVTASGQLTGDKTFAPAGTLTLGAAAAGSELMLKDGESVTITGIPADITSTVTEYNSSYDVYKPNITDTPVTGGTAAYTSANVNSGETAVITAVKGTNTSTTNALTAGDLSLTVTNEIEIVSPTGYVTRFAPYVLLVGFALALLVVMRRRRNDHADMI